jgi:predicted metal-dependent enzyme (double-stranded beta helix superfamily)
MSLPELEALLGGLLPARMRPEDLPALAAAWPEALDRAGLAARARFSDRGYTRTVLHRNTAWEVLLAGWLPGQRTAPHGHGESFGLICVLEGALTEVEYRLAARGQVMKAGRRGHRAGGVFREEPHTIHHVEHAGVARTVSLHLYAPPLERMELYEGSTGTSHPRGSGRREPNRSVRVR